jgi:hypothetical protein
MRASQRSKLFGHREHQTLPRCVAGHSDCHAKKLSENSFSMTSAAVSTAGGFPKGDIRGVWTYHFALQRPVAFVIDCFASDFSVRWKSAVFCGLVRSFSVRCASVAAYLNVDAARATIKKNARNGDMTSKGILVLTLLLGFGAAASFNSFRLSRYAWNRSIFRWYGASPARRRRQRLPIPRRGMPFPQGLSRQLLWA